ncbi:MAG: hypothetical protein COU63_00610 [Candidatus Pacebacteria bacterium CG10_big_fil_rev_8_21_14_0_10_36_11]|nr:hypothetical protein [Candidatus Pacearchaeota archaeon]OIP74529.1 MAG: hypothetical protein AUK08_00205 [Candidatus Pacebacteria bacterium CG2_30_36_39]PIR65155.1 MAG: hypothetical protein COU63_00610 [Candidatus Pacebacteria bacterium CG10_big_fil_rev_8_21_14_0_10_36_11]PJC42646.1 MAG: hypothetical protein CO040_03390 [Candidatus Pacebacteria bacterium CG_4_9_14_0_2_um_filter_36_8]
MKVSITTGSITATTSRVQAIATPINGTGGWYGAIDNAIYEIADEYYHQVPRQRLEAVGLNHGEVIVVKRTPDFTHRGNFDDVIFVVDRLRSPLNEVVYAALAAAKQVGYKSIAMPVMRTGRMAGRVEKSYEEVIRQIKLGFDRIMAEGNWDVEIQIVVYNDPETKRMLEEVFA